MRARTSMRGRNIGCAVTSLTRSPLIQTRRPSRIESRYCSPVRIIWVPIGFVIAAWHYRAEHEARQSAVALESGWHALLRHPTEGSMMAQIPRLLMVVGAATPPGRLAAAIAVAVEAVRGNTEDINVDV